MRVHLLIVVLLLPGVLSAQAPEQGPTLAGMSPSAFVEKWGEILYCQEAYKHPANKDRVYAYDTAQCHAAEQHLSGQLKHLDDPTRTQLNNAAKQRARVIRANTRDVAWVLGACREACQEVAAGAEDSTTGNSTPNSSQLSGLETRQ